MHILIHGKWKNFAFCIPDKSGKNITERTDALMFKHDLSAVTVKGGANFDAAG